MASLRSEYLLTNKITVENEYFIVLNEYFKAKSVNFKKKKMLYFYISSLIVHKFYNQNAFKVPKVTHFLEWHC